MPAAKLQKFCLSEGFSGVKPLTGVAWNLPLKTAPGKKTPKLQ